MSLTARSGSNIRHDDHPEVVLKPRIPLQERRKAERQAKKVQRKPAAPAAKPPPKTRQQLKAPSKPADVRRPQEATAASEPAAKKQRVVDAIKVPTSEPKPEGKSKKEGGRGVVRAATVDSKGNYLPEVSRAAFEEDLAMERRYMRLLGMKGKKLREGGSSKIGGPIDGLDALLEGIEAAAATQVRLVAVYEPSAHILLTIGPLAVDR